MIRNITTILTAITVFTLELLLGGCLLPVAKENADPVINTTSIPFIQAPAPTVDINSELFRQQENSLPADQSTTYQPESVWDRILSSQSLTEIDYKFDHATHEQVQTQLHAYAENQRFFDVISVRAKPFLYHIIQELEQRDMPLFLALLPIVESGYRTRATSPSQASGLWQIIPSTGKYFGLKQNWWYDGRLDVVASTQAALDYLQQLHDRFEDWPLALAAYNSGGSTVARAIKKNERLGRSTDYWSLDLPTETQQYIPKMIALETIISSPASYGITLTQIPFEPVLKTVDTKGQLQLEKAAALADINIEELRQLNAGHKRWATDPEGPHHLLVPIDSADRLTRAISTLPDEERLSWQHHKIQSGESLWTIARQYQISIHLLKSTNHLKTDKLRIGKNLVIPTGSFSEYIVSVAPPRPLSIPTLRGNKYRVKSGDSLWMIARRFDIHVQQILEWNQITKDQALKPGEELKILIERPILEAAVL